MPGKKNLVWLQAGKEGCSPCRNASSLMTNRLLEGSSLQNKAQAVSFWKQGWLGSRHLVVRALCRNVLRKLQNLSLVCYMLCNSDQQRDDYQPPAIPFQAKAVGTYENQGERVVILDLLKEVLFLKLNICRELPTRHTIPNQGRRNVWKSRGASGYPRPFEGGFVY